MTDGPALAKRQRRARRTMVGVATGCLLLASALAAQQVLHDGWASFIARPAGVGASDEVADGADAEVEHRGSELAASPVTTVPPVEVTTTTVPAPPPDSGLADVVPVRVSRARVPRVALEPPAPAPPDASPDEGKAYAYGGGHYHGGYHGRGGASGTRGTPESTGVHGRPGGSGSGDASGTGDWHHHRRGHHDGGG